MSVFIQKNLIRNALLNNNLIIFRSLKAYVVICFSLNRPNHINNIQRMIIWHYIYKQISRTKFILIVLLTNKKVKICYELHYNTLCRNYFMRYSKKPYKKEKLFVIQCQTCVIFADLCKFKLSKIIENHFHRTQYQ